MKITKEKGFLFTSYYILRCDICNAAIVSMKDPFILESSARVTCTDNPFCLARSFINRKVKDV